MPLALLLFSLLTIAFATPARGQSAESVTLSIVPTANPLVDRLLGHDTARPFTLVMADVPTITVEPLIPYVFFDSGSADIPERYVLFDAYEQTLTFDESELEGTIIGKYRHILNILGARMRRHPGIKVVVRGGAPEREEGDTLGDARSRSVYHYLREVWRLPDSLFVLPGGGRKYLEYVHRYSPGLDRRVHIETVAPASSERS